MSRDIDKRFHKCRKELKDLGEQRNNTVEQRFYLLKLAIKFQHLVTSALDGDHDADHLFKTEPELCIAPMIMARMKSFSNDMANFGHTYSFISQEEDEPTTTSDRLGEEREHTKPPQRKLEVRKEFDMPDLADILHPCTVLAMPHREDILNWIDGVYQDNRGFELGTFNASTLATVMKKQSFKWRDISLGFVSDVIVIVQDFINTALTRICTDSNVEYELMDKIFDELMTRYEKAISNTAFLLEVEKSGIPMTLDEDFDANVQKR